MSSSRNASSVRSDLKRQAFRLFKPRVWAMKRRNNCLGKRLFIASFFEEARGPLDQRVLWFSERLHQSRLMGLIWTVGC
ncbi:unnamed protein product [Trifolium pratense]|uniref:Uncharacterized protein n=1 Tax=Trifolium pratense TaxID=57577 RepID=A0ACB0IGA9_TRIPR|nr:unnamed protein product [Trifolium pratense]